MAADFLRAGGSRAHFLVASFALLSVILLFNWWSLSTDNLDLLRQIEDLTQHLKSSSSLLDQCRRDRTSLDSRVKRLEDDTEKLIQNLDSEKRVVDRLENNLKESNNEVLASQKKFDGSNSKLKNCVAELESLKKVDISKDGVIASMRIEKSQLSSQIQQLKEQVSKLDDQLKEEKLAISLLKKQSSSTAAVPSKVESRLAGDNASRNNIPSAAVDKESEHKEENNGDKDDNQQIMDGQEDPRWQEMQDTGDDKKEALT